jgi:5-(carboxyamino)imidazole ribonucleotide synthase
VLAVELFEVPGTAGGSTLVVNELAMRPHNSAHWTIEGSRTSQFEQHLRAVLDYPLGTTTLTAPWVVMANLLGGDGRTPTWTAGCTCCSDATRPSRCTSTARP